MVGGEIRPFPCQERLRDRHEDKNGGSRGTQHLMIGDWRSEGPDGRLTYRDSGTDQRGRHHALTSTRVGLAGQMGGAEGGRGRETVYVSVKDRKQKKQNAHLHPMGMFFLNPVSHPRVFQLIAGSACGLLLTHAEEVNLPTGTSDLTIHVQEAVRNVRSLFLWGPVDPPHHSSRSTWNLNFRGGELPPMPVGTL